MAVTDELKALLNSPEAQAALKEMADEAAAEANKPPEWYVHLADGSVHVLSGSDAESSHIDGIQVIARYQVGN